ncbi:MAG: hypothetical protein AAF483_23515 [Planctomycetota bacterium]
MAITVQLRVVGIYYNRPITFEVEPGTTPTVFSVMKAARDQFPISSPEGFDFVSTASTNPSMEVIRHNFSGSYDFDGNGVTTDPVDGPTLRGRSRSAGTYELGEQAIRGGLVGWQYYVVRGNTVVSTTPASRGFQSFAKFEVQDGDKVIWRLVAIATENTEELSRYDRIAKKS